MRPRSQSAGNKRRKRQRDRWDQMRPRSQSAGNKGRASLQSCGVAALFHSEAFFKIGVKRPALSWGRGGDGGEGHSHFAPTKHIRFARGAVNLSRTE